MEIIALVIALAAIFAAKSVAILRNQDEEIAKSVSFSWTKPGVKEAIDAPQVEVASEQASWTPTYVTTHARVA
jgi:hypothetical protein